MKICFIGSGYVGLVSGVCFSDLGNNVICIDKDREKLSRLVNGDIPIFEPGLSELVRKNLDAGRLSFSDDLIGSINKSDIVFILLGKVAQQFEDMISDKHLVLKASHPASAGYNKGVWNCDDVFNRANNYLKEKDKTTIQW